MGGWGIAPLSTPNLHDILPLRHTIDSSEKMFAHHLVTYLVSKAVAHG